MMKMMKKMMLMFFWLMDDFFLIYAFFVWQNIDQTKTGQEEKESEHWDLVNAI